jgi:hypothetical protein
MPDQPRGRGHAHQKHNGSCGKQETYEPHQKTHDKSSVSAPRHHNRRHPQREECFGSICDSANARNTLAAMVF